MSYEDGDLRIGARGGIRTLAACRFFVRDPLTTKNVGRREGEYIFHPKKIIEKYIFFLEKNDFENFEFGILLKFLV